MSRETSIATITARLRLAAQVRADTADEAAAITAAAELVTGVFRHHGKVLRYG